MTTHDDLHTEIAIVRRELAETIKQRDEARAEVARLTARIDDACFSCPRCGGHDFGFFAEPIKAACGPCRARAEAAEQQLRERAVVEAQLREAVRTLAGAAAEARGLLDCPPEHRLPAIAARLLGGALAATKGIVETCAKT